MEVDAKPYHGDHSRGFYHPDVEIAIFGKTTYYQRTRNQIEYAVMNALVAAGLPVKTLRRAAPAKRKRKAPPVSEMKQERLF